MKIGELVQPYMVQDPYAKFPLGLLVRVDVGIYRSSGRRRLDKDREYRVYHVLVADTGLQTFEEPFWSLRPIR